MSIDKNQVKKVAKLSRISLDDKKLKSLSKDLVSILHFVEELKKLDTKKTEPLTSILDKTLEPRDDKINDGSIKDQILKNSPEENDEFFVVPKVIE